jgi:hypothetical protein
MSDLSRLGKALRDERGAPPVAWQHEQRIRLRTEQVAAPHRPQFRWAMAVELTPVWWTPRKGLLSKEIHQCKNENHDQNHSRGTRCAA